MEAVGVTGRSGRATAAETGRLDWHSGARLSLRDLEVWRGDYCVCNGLTLAVHSGQLLHLRGGNGAGKTSLMRVLAGLALAEAGDILLGDTAVSRQMSVYRAAICYVGHTNGIKLELTPLENLRLTAGLAHKAASRGAESALERVGLGAHMDRLAGTLSAGQRRRSALARLLITEAPIWFLDEPLVSLDHTGAALVEALIREHLGHGGIAVLATHQTIDLARLDVVAVDLPESSGRC